MPRYFFDIRDDAFTRDEDGIECADFAAVCREAKRTLPDIARDVLPKDGEQHSISVIVRDERDHPVYTATLTFTGLKLSEPKA